MQDSIGKTVAFSLFTGKIKEVSAAEAPDLLVNSQPLWFGFKFPSEFKRWEYLHGSGWLEGFATGSCTAYSSR
jgi:hypothetical protein